MLSTGRISSVFCYDYSNVCRFSGPVAAGRGRDQARRSDHYFKQARAASGQGRRLGHGGDGGAARRQRRARCERSAEGPARDRDREPRQPRLRQLHGPRHFLAGLLQPGHAGLRRRRASGFGEPGAGPLRRRPDRTPARAAGHALRDERLRGRAQHRDREAALRPRRRVRHRLRAPVRDRHLDDERAHPRRDVPRSRLQGALLHRPDPGHRPPSRRRRLVERPRWSRCFALRAARECLRRQPDRLARCARARRPTSSTPT